VRYELCIRLTEVPLLAFRLTRGIERVQKDRWKNTKNTRRQEIYFFRSRCYYPFVRQIIKEHNARLIHETYAEASDIISSYPSKLTDIPEVNISAIIHSRFVSLNYSSRIAYFQYESSCEEGEGEKKMITRYGVSRCLGNELFEK